MFGVYLVAAFVLLRYRFGADHWFAGDDWGMIVERRISEPADWMQPQNRHWLLLPTFVYQFLFETVGLRSYGPYQAVVILLHLSLASLVRLTMRRSGVGPWTATLVAGTFVLLGAAYQAMLLAIMVGPLLSLVFGFGQLLLADHDGRIDRRDWLGLGAGLVAISSSGLGPVFVAVVGMATFARRGWRAAAFHAGPLTVIWGLWYLVWGRDEGGTPTKFDVTTARQWLATGWSGVFEAIGGYSGVAIALGVLLAAGLVLAWARLDWSTLRRRAAVPAALVVGGALLFVLTSSQRALIADPASSRYLGWAAPMILPALAVAAFAFIQRWRWTAPVIALLFLVGVPRGIDELQTESQNRADFTQRGRDLLLAAAYSPVVDEVPDDVFPDPNQQRGAEVTTGFLRDVRADGKLPDDPGAEPQVARSMETRLRLSQSAYDEAVPSEWVCRRYTEPQVVDGHFGDRFAFVNEIRVVPVGDDGKNLGPAVSYSAPWNGRILTVQVPELRFRLEGRDGAVYSVCR